jgi:hypothetical protein
MPGAPIAVEQAYEFVKGRPLSRDQNPHETEAHILREGLRR